MKHLFWLAAILAGCAKPETHQPAVKPLMEAVYASGAVVADEEYQLFSQADGVIKEIVASEGQELRAGDAIIVVESNQQDARFGLAREAFELAAKNRGPSSPALREVRTAVETARARFRLDSLNQVRYANLWQQRAVKQVDYDRARLAYQQAGNDLTIALERLQRTADELELAYRQAESQWKIAQEESGNYTLRSEIDGMVFRITKEKGELVRRGELLAVVGRKAKFHLRLAVDELDVNRVQVGQPVLVKIEAYEGKVFPGKVSQVYPLVDIRQQALRVDATLDEPLPGWFTGLTVEANIVIRQKDQALVIPKKLLLPGDTVLVQSDKGVQRTKIRKGIETMEEVEILEGLSAESQLIVQ